MANIICFKQEKGLKKLLKFIVKGHGYTLKTSIFAIFQKSAKKGGGDTVRCAPKLLTLHLTKLFVKHTQSTFLSVQARY